MLVNSETRDAPAPDLSRSNLLRLAQRLLEQLCFDLRDPAADWFDPDDGGFGPLASVVIAQSRFGDEDAVESARPVHLRVIGEI
jgi:hypothetical protein